MEWHYLYGMEKQSHVLAQNIRVLRKRNGWTQSDLAEKLDCTQEIIAYYENGERKPPADKIPLIANIFGVTIDELFGTKPIKANGREKNPKLWRKFEQLEQLAPSDRKTIFRMIEGFALQRR